MVNVKGRLNSRPFCFAMWSTGKDAQKPASVQLLPRLMCTGFHVGVAVGSLTVLDGKDMERKLTDKGGGKFTFTMPADKVTVEASFKEEFPDLPNPFSDLAPSDFC